MATPSAIKRVEDAIANNEVGKELKKAVMRSAAKLYKEVPVAWPADRDDLLDVSREALRRLQTFGMAWLLEKDPRYVARANIELAAICDFQDWNPSHFLDTAEMTHAVGIGYDWFYDQLTPIELETYRAAILKKGLTPGLAQLNNPDPGWPSRTNNWNIVCNAGLIIGALAVGEEPTGLTKEIFHRCLDSVPNGFRGYSPEGSWDEGPGYWSYATEYAAYLLSALRTAVGHEFGLGDLPGVRHAGFFRMYAEGSAVWKDEDTGQGKGALMFNFSDCAIHPARSWCMRWLFLRYGKPEYNWMALKNAQTRPMDLLWFSPDTSPKPKPVPANALFRGGANVAMFRGTSQDKRSGFQPWEQHQLASADTVYLGMRAGANSLDNHHGHLDLGSFVLDAGQVRWAIDIPPVEKPPPGCLADYKLPGYFVVNLNRRFRYYRTNTFGHNTLVINGQNQPLGIETEIVGFRATPDLAVAVLDLTAAYPDCVRVRRGFALIDQQHVLIVDEVTPNQHVNIAWQMHTMASPTALGSTVKLTQPGWNGGTKDFFVQVLDLDKTVFEIQPATVTQPQEAPNDEHVQKLVANLRNVNKPTRIAVYLSAQSGFARWPELLDGPLWSWIAWAGDHPDPKAELSWIAM